MKNFICHAWYVISVLRSTKKWTTAKIHMLQSISSLINTQIFKKINRKRAIRQWFLLADEEIKLSLPIITILS
jgi:hypothetical protein